MDDHMTYSWFVWRGRDSRALGVALAAYPEARAPAPRVTRVAVPGRSGTVAVAGIPAWDAYRLVAEVLVEPGWSAREAAAWLRGRGELIFGDEPDRVFDAEVTGGLRLKAMPGGWASGKLSFNVQPLRGQYPPETDIELTAAGNVYNPGDVPSRPVYIIDGAGLLELNINYDENDDDSPGSQITIDLTDTELLGAMVDTETMMVTTTDGKESLNHLAAIYGNGERGLWLPKGASAVSWDTTTVDGVTIRPRWRWF